ncbi:IspD/TarI family cytidylyltransferase [Alicyclobacillus acidocaldarius]|uniref:4-diphosphocytidyl-2C-methyl-D-erythritolsynthas e n=1 Tax=Alicyclobacillus acidocaldarius (strain Tc-4-1) TaxID=1048834 RepID=F8ILJ6_ALIAT|nr:IspD/TarI family cytidylyltransferase [Alicyclobacillus acidocaldarius]AEJ44950.1 4-diphosphocytidyl-2C-methyl-D-erythritolsynthas e [Alicyclobacillus acidocaldarius subsp. acidocaldarius Tc-4-1]
MWVAIVVAAGEGRRMGFKKQFLDLAGRPMWLRSVEAMISGGADEIVVVASPGDVHRMQEEARVAGRELHFAEGGETRHASVVSGVKCALELMARHQVDPARSAFAIHDAARPFVAEEDVRRVFEAAIRFGGAVLGTPCRDTVKRVEGGLVQETVPRDNLFLAETPQAIRADLVSRVYLERPYSADDSPTDDSGAMEAAGVPVVAVTSTAFNGKITTPADLDYARWLARERWGRAEHADWTRV